MQKYMHKFIPTLIMTFIVAAIFNSESVSDGIEKGMLICAHTIIPSLFPFMVLSDILINCMPAGGGKKSVYFLGLLCGFPIGAKSAGELHERQFISSDEAWTLTLLSNNASPAFIIGTVGAVLLKKPMLGIALFAAQTLSALIISPIFSRISLKVKERQQNFAKAEQNICYSDLFLSAIKRATNGMLMICSLIMFFSMIISFISSVAPISNLTKALFSAIFELGNGCVASAALFTELNFPSIFLLGFSAGFSGICVCMQTATVAYKGFSLAKYIGVKLVQGIFCGLLFTGAYVLCENIDIDCGFSLNHNAVLALWACGAVFMVSAFIVKVLRILKKRGTI